MTNMVPEDERVHDIILENMIEARREFRRVNGYAPGQEIYIEMSAALAEKLGIKCD